MRDYFTGFAGITSEQDLKILTGIKFDVFNHLLKFIIPGKDGQPQFFRTLSTEDRLLLFLMKLKLGISFSAIGLLFGVSRQTVSNIFFSVLETVYKNVKKWIFWPSKEAVKQTMPDTFVNYPDCRVIIDCTEVYTDTPSRVDERIHMFSQYKDGYTAKFLLGISPSGMITFLSRSYAGRSTDSFIVNDSGFLNYIEPGDQILADKGFPQIKAEALQRNCIVVIPLFAFNPQFTKEEVLEQYSIASVRIHIERAIQRVKIFKILQHLNTELFETIDEIMYVICALANHKEPLIKKNE
ncbi:uncharacterized protein LOC131675090 [Phymastichus coffea]|uniref:uncharacterized protein LOC131675090 n=1 Tax=Phymastichus coffea TaxID=108790 RepID=UPI00273B8405|nr:uncharacterized protein LOC131675090 [Phymastichus coffea]